MRESARSFAVEIGGGQFFFLDSPDLTPPAYFTSLNLFFSSSSETKPLNSARRLRSPLHRGHGRRLDGHRVGAGGGQGLEQQGLDFDFFEQRRRSGGVLCLPEEDGDDDARWGASRPLPFAERGRVGLDRHLELPGEDF